MLRAQSRPQWIYFEVTLAELTIQTGFNPEKPRLAPGVLSPYAVREWSRGLDCAVYIADTDDVVLEDFHIFWACDEPGWKHGLIAENNRDLVIAENCRLPEPETKE